MPDQTGSSYKVMGLILATALFIAARTTDCAVPADPTDETAVTILPGSAMSVLLNSPRERSHHDDGPSVQNDGAANDSPAETGWPVVWSDAPPSLCHSPCCSGAHPLASAGEAPVSAPAPEIIDDPIDAPVPVLTEQPLDAPVPAFAKRSLLATAVRELADRLKISGRIRVERDISLWYWEQYVGNRRRRVLAVGREIRRTLEDATIDALYHWTQLGSPARTAEEDTSDAAAQKRRF